MFDFRSRTGCHATIIRRLQLLSTCYPRTPSLSPTWHRLGQLVVCRPPGNARTSSRVCNDAREEPGSSLRLPPTQSPPPGTTDPRADAFQTPFAISLHACTRCLWLLPSGETTPHGTHVRIFQVSSLMSYRKIFPRNGEASMCN